MMNVLQQVLEHQHSLSEAEYERSSVQRAEQTVETREAARLLGCLREAMEKIQRLRFEVRTLKTRVYAISEEETLP